ncbi:MAG: hypothetical protein U5K37_11575 [Natrialbaceae archaeon]|nr:hypothetical protein [Natrialbaceae archaeon]
MPGDARELVEEPVEVMGSREEQVAANAPPVVVLEGGEERVLESRLVVVGIFPVDPGDMG